MQCFPLYSLLLAMGNPTVNLFVLDIEGFELAVLESIPWDKVDIEVLDVETDLAGIFQKGKGRITTRLTDFKYSTTLTVI